MNKHTCLCKCTASIIKPWCYATKRSRVWETMGYHPVSSQARCHTNPLCCEIQKPRLLCGSYVRFGLWSYVLFECSPTGQLLITRLYQSISTTFSYGPILTALVTIDCIKILVSYKAVLLIQWAYLDNRTWFAVNNTRHPHEKSGYAAHVKFDPLNINSH